MDSPEQLYGGPGAFATTHWSLVVQAVDIRVPEAALVMERLVQTYLYPLYERN